MNILIPHNWLLEYCPTHLTSEEITRRVSLCGVCVEKVEKISSQEVVKGKSEYVYDIEVTSNRPDMLSLIGIAREIGAILKEKLVLPEIPPIPTSVSSSKKLEIEILEPKLCPRYLGVLLEGVEVGPSPAGIASRLELAGLRPINNVVDITNYVMLEYGQPLHAFDADRLDMQNEIPEIIIRRAKRGEKITTLDDQTFELKEDMLVIADRKSPIALAGIKGGKKAEVTLQTKRIILECANFNPLSIRRTSRVLSLQTDASARFEKGLSPLDLETPFARALDLLQKFTQGKISSRSIDVYPKKFNPKKIEFNPTSIMRLLGEDIPQSRAVTILESLGFLVKKEKSKMVISVPSWRYYDVEGEEDLVEDIARIYGYHKLQGKLLDTRIPEEIRTNEFLWEEKSKDILVGAGFNEVYTYSFISKELLAKCGYTAKDNLQIINPLSQEFEYLRQDLVPSLLDVAKENRQRSEEIKIFELARIYLGRDSVLPREERHLAGLWWRKRGQTTLFYQMKGVVENLLDGLGVHNFVWKKGEGQLVVNGGNATLNIVGKELGFLGIVKPTFTSNFKLKDTVVVFDLNFEELLKHFSAHKTYQPLPKYPAVSFDLSIVIPEETLWQEVESKIKNSGRKLVERVQFLEAYRGKQISQGKKGLFLRIVYRSSKRSLKEEEAKVVHQKIIHSLKTELGTIIREG